MKLLHLYFSFNGRLSIKDFWLYWVLPLNLGGAILSYILVRVFFFPEVRDTIGLFLLWPFFATLVKRLHDRNLSAWFLLLNLIPILGSIFLFIQAYCLPGTKGENRFDPSYKESHPEEFLTLKQRGKIFVVILIAFQILCLFTGKSILGIIHIDGPYYGRVVDAENGSPIAGAAIAGVWEFEHSALLTTFTKFAGVQETVTDQEGKFYLPRDWFFTLWVNAAKLEISNLYVFKSGYDSHPPYMQKHWSKEDVQRRNMTRGEYQGKYKKRCEPEKECVVQLMPTQTEMERSAAYAGAHIGGLPVKLKTKIRNYINTVNIEGDKIGADRWPIE